MSRGNGLYEYWKLPSGGSEIEGLLGARQAVEKGAYLYIGSSVRKFRIHHASNFARFPWRLAENWVVGTSHPRDNYEHFREFSSLKEAVREARRLASESAIRRTR